MVNGDLENDGYNPAVGSGAFTNCTGIQYVIFNGSVGTVDQRAFSNCTALETVEFNGPVGILSNNAFSGCTSLTTVYIESLEQIRNTVFNGCDALESITFNCDVPAVNGNKPIGSNSEDLVIYYPGEYTGWEEMPLGEQYTYIPFYTMPHVEMIAVELRTRPNADDFHDMRFIAKVYNLEGYTVTAQYMMLYCYDTDSEVVVNCAKKYEAFPEENAYTYTLVLKSIHLDQCDYYIEAMACIIVDGETEVYSNVIGASVNELINE